MSVDFSQWIRCACTVALICTNPITSVTAEVVQNNTPLLSKKSSDTQEKKGVISSTWGAMKKGGSAVAALPGKAYNSLSGKAKTQSDKIKEDAGKAAINKLFTWLLSTNFEESIEGIVANIVRSIMCVPLKQEPELKPSWFQKALGDPQAQKKLQQLVTNLKKAALEGAKRAAQEGYEFHTDWVCKLPGKMTTTTKTYIQQKAKSTADAVKLKNVSPESQQFKTNKTLIDSIDGDNVKSPAEAEKKKWDALKTPEERKAHMKANF